jgi:hypothetical protein
VADPAERLDGGSGHDTDGGRRVVREPVSVDVLCSVGVGELVTAVSKATALYRLATHVMNLQKVGRASLPGLAKLVERAQCFEIRSAKPPESLEAVLLAMRGGAS